MLPLKPLIHTTPCGIRRKLSSQYCGERQQKVSHLVGGGAPTVTVKLHVLAPQVLLAVQVTVVTPTGKVVPEAGVQDTAVPVGVTVGALYVTVTPPAPVAVAVTLVGQVSVTFGVTVTVKLHDVGVPPVFEVQV